MTPKGVSPMTEHDECSIPVIIGRSVLTPNVCGIHPLRFPTCYLCREALPGETTHDHVPPKQLFQKAFRRANATDQLEWLPTHRSCNWSYQRDETTWPRPGGPATALTASGHALVLETELREPSHAPSIPLGHYIQGRKFVRSYSSNVVRSRPFRILMSMTSATRRYR
jgi:hypothetical protein